MLLLFDIDGTLIKGTQGPKEDAMLDAAEELYGVKMYYQDFYGINPYGKTDKQIMREMLLKEGVANQEIDNQLEEWVRLSCLYLSNQPMKMKLLPGVEWALDELKNRGHELALLSGNLEPIARERMRQLKLDKYFKEGLGAFGTDSEDRNQLVLIALERSRAKASETVVIGDTPKDIECARAGGAKVVAITSGGFSYQALKAADQVIDELYELPEIIGTL